ncbi:MAG: MarC family protein [Verrucomicrobiales bacterium]|nr:MarC family protein [Verrucomicrobiales bacterium]
MSLLSATLTLLLVMDPLGNIPLFMTTVKNVPESRRTKIIARELLFALLIMLAVFWGGQAVMQVFHLSVQALRIAGGILLFLIALRMIFPDSREERGERLDEEPFIVPLATPMIVGPSVIATLLLLVSNYPERRGAWLLALLIAWVVVALVLMSAPFLARILRRRGLMAVERLMGMLLVVVSVQMFLDGLQIHTGG